VQKLIAKQSKRVILAVFSQPQIIHPYLHLYCWKASASRTTFFKIETFPHKASCLFVSQTSCMSMFKLLAKFSSVVEYSLRCYLW